MATGGVQGCRVGQELRKDKWDGLEGREVDESPFMRMQAAGAPKVAYVYLYGDAECCDRAKDIIAEAVENREQKEKNRRVVIRNNYRQWAACSSIAVAPAGQQALLSPSSSARRSYSV